MNTLAEILCTLQHNSHFYMHGPSAHVKIQMETEDPCSGVIYLTVRTTRMKKTEPAAVC